MKNITNDKEAAEAAQALASYIEGKEGSQGIALATVVSAIGNHVGGRGVTTEETKVIRAAVGVFNEIKEVPAHSEPLVTPSWQGANQPPDSDE